MTELSIKELIELLNPIQTYNIESQNPNFSFNTDSRIIDNGWFIALKGDRFNGNQFADIALDNGAQGLILSENPTTETISKNKPILIVEDTLKAYQQIANYYRKQLKAKVIAITGSNGKTTTKEALSQILADQETVYYTQANENNEIGVPKTILNTPQDTQYLILELGMRGLGEIAELTKIAEPDYSIITNIGTAHIGRLGSQENITKAKSEIFTSAPNTQKVYLPKNQKELFRTHVSQKPLHTYNYYGDYEIYEQSNNQITFEYKDNKYSLNTNNHALIHNTCGIIDICRDLSIEPKDINQSLNKIQSIKGRGQIHNLPSGGIIIDETYNSSPESVLALAKSNNNNNSYKVLILGHIAELGDKQEKLITKLYKDLSNYADLIILYGNNSEWPNIPTIETFIRLETFSEIQSYLIDNDLLNRKDIILALKGSRIAELDKLLLDILTQNKSH